MFCVLTGLWATVYCTPNPPGMLPEVKSMFLQIPYSNCLFCSKTTNYEINKVKEGWTWMLNILTSITSTEDGLQVPWFQVPMK